MVKGLGVWGLVCVDCVALQRELSGTGVFKRTS